MSALDDLVDLLDLEAIEDVSDQEEVRADARAATAEVDRLARRIGSRPPTMTTLWKRAPAKLGSSSWDAR